MKRIFQYENKMRMEMKIMLLMKFLNLLFGGGMSGFRKLVQNPDSNRLSRPNTPFFISVTFDSYFRRKFYLGHILNLRCCWILSFV